MIEQKHELPNGNVFIWLGNQPIHDCEHVLILAGGDVLFLKTIKRDHVEKLRSDIRSLDKQEFFDEYQWQNNSSCDDLYWELREIYMENM